MKPDKLKVIRENDVIVGVEAICENPSQAEARALKAAVVPTLQAMGYGAQWFNDTANGGFFYMPDGKHQVNYVSVPREKVNMVAPSVTLSCQMLDKESAKDRAEFCEKTFPEFVEKVLDKAMDFVPIYEEFSATEVRFALIVKATELNGELGKSLAKKIDAWNTVHKAHEADIVEIKESLGKLKQASLDGLLFKELQRQNAELRERVEAMEAIFRDAEPFDTERDELRFAQIERRLDGTAARLNRYQRRLSALVLGAQKTDKAIERLDKGILDHNLRLNYQEERMDKQYSGFYDLLASSIWQLIVGRKPTKRSGSTNSASRSSRRRSRL